MKKNHYEVLNLARDCSAKEIKESFIKLSKKYHPDVNCNSDAQKKFVEINEAYSVLGKSDKRKWYDDMLSQRHYYRNEDIMNPNAMRRERYAYNEFYQRQNMNSNYDYTLSSKNIKHKMGALVFCVFLISLGTVIQLNAMKKKVHYRNHLASLHLKQARERGEYRKKLGIPANEMFGNSKTSHGGDDKKN